MAGHRIPSLNWLRVFETAAKAESFARAAEVLNMSPPAVSQQIRALETHLGRALFHRGPRAVRLTEAGRAYLPVVSNALASVETTTASLFGRRDAQPLVVRASAMLAGSWLAAALPAFLAAHPRVQLTLVSAIAEEDFARRGADLQITFGQPPGPGEEGDPLFGERLAPVATAAIAAEVRTPGDLLRHPLIEVTSHRATWYRLLPEAADMPSAPRFIYTDTTITALGLAAAGGGIALARAPASDRLVAMHGLAPCLADVWVAGADTYHLVYPSRATLSPAAAVFRTWLLERAAAETAAR